MTYHDRLALMADAKKKWNLICSSTFRRATIEAMKTGFSIPNVMAIGREQALDEFFTLWRRQEKRLPWGTRRAARRLALRGFQAAATEMQDPRKTAGRELPKEVLEKAQRAIETSIGLSPIAWWILFEVLKIFMPLLIDWIWTTRELEFGGEGIAIVGPVDEAKEVQLWNG